MCDWRVTYKMPKKQKFSMNNSSSRDAAKSSEIKSQKLQGPLMYIFIDRIQSIHFEISYTCIRVWRTVAWLSPRIPIAHHITILSGLLCNILARLLRSERGFCEFEKEEEEKSEIFIPISITSSMHNKMYDDVLVDVRGVVLYPKTHKTQWHDNGMTACSCGAIVT